MGTGTRSTLYLDGMRAYFQISGTSTDFLARSTFKFGISSVKVALK
jgi:hypothetical protein